MLLEKSVYNEQELHNSNSYFNMNNVIPTSYKLSPAVKLLLFILILR